MELKELFDKKKDLSQEEFRKKFQNALLQAGHHEQHCSKCGASFIPILNGGTFHPEDGMRCYKCSVGVAA